MDTRPYWFGAELPTFPRLERDLDVDVVVIGAGLTGVTAAWLFKQIGVRVVLLERQRCASADTGHTTAHLTYVTDTRLSSLNKNFGRDAAQAFWEGGAVAIDQIYDIVRGLKIDCDFRWVPGYLHASLDRPNAKERASFEEDVRLANDGGFRAELVEKVPCVDQVGVRFPHQAKFHPRRYLAKILEHLPGDGSYVFEESAVSSVETEPLSVKVGEHQIRCRYVMIATHSPIMGEASLTGATLFQTKLALYTSYVVGAALPAGTLPEALFWDTSDPYYYLRVDRHPDSDYVIFGGLDSKTGQEEDPVKVFERLEGKLQQVLPNAKVKDHWLGQVVETNDGLPYIGENAPGQFIATGYAGNGFTLGTLAAIMARDRFQGKFNPWLELFEITRRKLYGGTWRYVTENVDYPYYLLRDRLARPEVESIDQVKFGEGKIAKLNGKKVAAYRDDTGKLTLLSPVCTHLGCLVRWNDADRTWDCPCHGSRFKATGAVFSGPAETALEEADS